MTWPNLSRAQSHQGLAVGWAHDSFSSLGDFAEAGTSWSLFLLQWVFPGGAPVEGGNLAQWSGACALELDRQGYKTCLCHLWAVWAWAMKLLNLPKTKFLTCKGRIIAMPSWQNYCEERRSYVWKVLGTVPRIWQASLTVWWGSHQDPTFELCYGTL